MVALPVQLAKRGGVSKRVLIVDDDPDVTWVMEDLLRLIGHEARAANTAAEALEIARVMRPNLALVDVHGVGGHELARRLREQAAGEPIEIVAISGRLLSPDESPAFDAAYLKPVGLADLVRVIERR